MAPRCIKWPGRRQWWEKREKKIEDEGKGREGRPEEGRGKEGKKGKMDEREGGRNCLIYLGLSLLIYK